MSRHGYGYVTDKGFASFPTALGEGAWGAVSIEAIDDDGDPPIASTALLDAPVAAVWKVRATWAIRALVRAVGTATADELRALDAEWDSSQRALSLAVLGEAEHQDAERRAAAERLRTALLMGGGTGQAQLSYDKEVDFGHAQLELASRSPLSDDVEAAGLAPHLERVRQATEALAAGLGRGAGENRPAPRSRRIRSALSACISAFNVIHEELEWMIEHTAAGEERQRLEALRAPLLALLERYPPRVKTSVDEVEDEEANEEPAGDARA